MSPQEHSDLFSVGEIARYCYVNRRTVHRWINDGKLQAFSLPSGHYRVSRTNFKSFLAQYKIPLHKEDLFHGPKLMIAGGDFQDQQVIEQTLHKVKIEAEIEHPEDFVAVCLKVSSFQPDLLIVFDTLDESQIGSLVRSLRRMDEVSKTVIAFAGDAINFRRYYHLGFNENLSKPIKEDEIIQIANKYLV